MTYTLDGAGTQGLGRSLEKLFALVDRDHQLVPQLVDLRAVVSNLGLPLLFLN